MEDGPQLASLRHVGLSAPIAAAMLGSLYGELKARAKARSDSNGYTQNKSKGNGDGRRAVTGV